MSGLALPMRAVGGGVVAAVAAIIAALVSVRSRQGQAQDEKALKPWELTDEQKEILKGNCKLFNRKELTVLKMLLEESQGHVIAFWSVVGTNDGAKRRLVKQLMKLDSNYPGGLRAYIRNARRLLKQAAQGENPLDGYTPSVPQGVTLSLTKRANEFLEYESKGLAAAANSAFVLVAGGLGERLGYSGIKVSLPTETATYTTFLQLYVQTILQLQRRSGARRPLQLAIMTSDDTHSDTVDLLKQHQYFGAKASQIHLLKQDKVACLADNAATLALEAEDPYCMQTKPHGHGDVHALMYSSGLAARWQKDGVKWVAFFQDTNAMVFRGLLPTLGVSEEFGWDVNSLAVPRFAKEAIGAICCLTHKDGSKMTVNVEYNQLDPLLRATTFPNGDVNDSSGHSPFPGNINQLVLKLGTYVEQLKATEGIIEEFVNPKYKNAARTLFKKPTRLECMMQDYPKSLPPSAGVGFTTIEEVWATYSPVKNSVEEAQAKAKAGAPTHSATQGELDIYAANCRILGSQGASVASAVPVAFNGIPLKLGPRVVLTPTFATSLSDIEAKFSDPKKVSVTLDSTLILHGDQITIDKLDLAGALVITVANGASLHIRSLRVRNDGWVLKAVKKDDDEPEFIKIRGFVTDSTKGCYIHVASGNAEIDDGVEEENVAITYRGSEARRQDYSPVRIAEMKLT